eukprot:2360555-Rhodomonas_salina.1
MGPHSRYDGEQAQCVCKPGSVSSLHRNNHLQPSIHPFTPSSSHFLSLPYLPYLPCLPCPPRPLLCGVMCWVSRCTFSA